MPHPDCESQVAAAVRQRLWVKRRRCTAGCLIRQEGDERRSTKSRTRIPDEVAARKSATSLCSDSRPSIGDGIWEANQADAGVHFAILSSNRRANALHSLPDSLCLPVSRRDSHNNNRQKGVHVCVCGGRVKDCLCLGFEGIRVEDPSIN